MGYFNGWLLPKGFLDYQELGSAAKEVSSDRQLEPILEPPLEKIYLQFYSKNDKNMLRLAQVALKSA